MCMTRLKMYDILRESEKREEIENKLDKYIKYELSYEDQDRTYEPIVMMYKSMSDGDKVHVTFENVPLNIKSNTIDPNIFNTALNKLVEKLKGSGYTSEDFGDRKFRVIGFHVIVPNPDYKYSIDLGALSFNFLKFDLTDYLSTSLNNIVYRQEYSFKDLYSGDLLKDVGPLPKVDVDLKKWNDIEYKKILTATKHLLKGKVDDTTYDINNSHVHMFIQLDRKLYRESENYIHPVFKSMLKINLSKYFYEDTDEYDKVKNHIENRLKKFGIDNVEFN
jgi:hypothetical protein